MLNKKDFELHQEELERVSGAGRGNGKVSRRWVKEQVGEVKLPKIVGEGSSTNVSGEGTGKRKKGN